MYLHFSYFKTDSVTYSNFLRILLLSGTLFLSIFLSSNLKWIWNCVFFTCVFQIYRKKTFFCPDVSDDLIWFTWWSIPIHQGYLTRIRHVIWWWIVALMLPFYLLFCPILYEWTGRFVPVYIIYFLRSPTVKMLPKGSQLT